MKLKILEAESKEQLKKDIDIFRKILIFKDCSIKVIKEIEQIEDGRLVFIAGVAYLPNKE